MVSAMNEVRTNGKRLREGMMGLRMSDGVAGVLHAVGNWSL